MRKPQMLDALFPKTRQNVLSTLLISPGRRWNMSELAHQLHVRPSSLQRELASLTEAGILRRDTEANRTYFTANIESPLLPDLQSLFAKTSGLANKIKNALEVFDNEIEVAFIFGSVARGERRSESDVDVLVIGNVTAKDLAIPISKLEKELRIQLNFVKYSKEEFSEMIRNNNHFLQTVLDDQKIFLKGYADELAKLAGEP